MEVTMFIDHPHRTHSNVTEHLNCSYDTIPCPLGGDVRADPDRHPHYTLGLTLSCIYIIFLFPIGFFGNILILTVNLGHKGRMSAPDLYFVNLAAADLVLVADSLIEVFNLSPRYYDNMVILCTFMELFLQVNMYSSVFFLTWMSLDRFAALGGCFTLRGCSPGGQEGWGGLGRRMPHARLSCCLIWGTSALLTLLPFTIVQLLHAGETHFCFGNVSQIQWLEVTLGFLVPFSVLGLCYWRIGHVLGRSHREQDSSGLRRRPRRQKALKMISAAVLVFFLCWLPENVFISVHLLRGDPDEDGTSGGLGAGTLWHDYPLTAHIVSLAAFSNSCLNPLVYSFLGETFRDKLRVFLKQNASWAMLHSSHLGNSSDQSAGNSYHRRTNCPTTQPPPSSYCLYKPVMHPSNPNLPDILHHKYALDS